MNWDYYLGTIAGTSKTTQHWSAIATNISLAFDIAYFCLILFSLHFATAAIAIALGRSLPLFRSNPKANAVVPFLLLVLLQIGWNYELFPASRSSIFLEPILLTKAWPILFIIAHLIVSLLIARLLMLAPKRINTQSKKVVIVSGAVITLSAVTLIAHSIITEARTFDLEARTNISKPNIFIIGVDSLRPDFIPFLKSEMGNDSALIKQLESSTVFNDTITPLARTFPAWMSILTGQLPYAHGAIDNLIDPSDITATESIAWELMNAGYVTIYSTDEKRFSNIDERYGFQEIVGPKVGSLDFVLGSFTDFPLANLTTSTNLGKYLFPYSHLNRAAAYQYLPDNFIDTSLDRINKIPKDKPIFAAIHLCLAHWPYVWSEFDFSLRNKYRLPEESSNLPADYRISLMRVDQQLSRLLVGLKKSGRLENSIVVLLSDHGEGLGLSTDELQRPEGWSDQYLPIGRNPGGHGSDVLSAAHHKVLLSIKYNKTEPQLVSSDFPASLVDIAPTIRDLIGLPEQPTDGLSLFAKMQGTNRDLTDVERVRYWESGFRPKALLTPEINASAVAQEQARHYEILNNGWLALKKSSLSEMRDQKQIAVGWKSWVIAATNDDNVWRVVVGNWRDMKWVMFEDSSLPEKHWLLSNLCAHSEKYSLSITPFCN